MYTYYMPDLYQRDRFISSSIPSSGIKGTVHIHLWLVSHDKSYPITVQYLHVILQESQPCAKTIPSMGGEDHMATAYKIVVQTGTIRRSGTDANVYITLYGPNGNSGERFIDNAQDNFENGKIDEFGFDARDLGDLTHIEIRHDNSGTHPGWFLDKIDVIDQTNNRTFTFPCNQWLARDEGDGRISRILKVA